MSLLDIAVKFRFVGAIKLVSLIFGFAPSNSS